MSQYVVSVESLSLTHHRYYPPFQNSTSAVVPQCYMLLYPCLFMVLSNLASRARLFKTNDVVS